MKSAASTFWEAFGSERKPSPVSHVQVSHGIAAVAVPPLTVSGTVDGMGPSQKKTGCEDVLAGNVTVTVSVASQHAVDVAPPIAGPRANSRKLGRL